MEGEIKVGPMCRMQIRDLDTVKLTAGSWRSGVPRGDEPGEMEGEEGPRRMTVPQWPGIQKVLILCDVGGTDDVGVEALM